MLTRQCCCDGGCCEAWLTDQFVTIFGTLMDSAVPVATTDLISLKVNRPQSRTRGREFGWLRPESGQEPIPCLQCCTPGSLNACSICPPTNDCVACPQGGDQCGPGNLFAGTSSRNDYFDQVATPCCDFCGDC